MKRITIFRPFVAVMVIMLLSCFSSHVLAQSGEDVRYEEYGNASVLKGAKDGTLTLVIKNKKDMERVFGPSGFIGPSRIIDFDREFVIAVVVPKNIAEATIEPVSLKRKGNKLVFSYTIDASKKAYNNNDRNFVALIVDRKELMKVDFQEVSSNGVALNDSKDVNALRKQVKYLTSENEELKKNVQGLLNRIQELEAERVYYINKLKEVQTENEQLKKIVRH
ncbi:MAG: hypothetical protein J5629_09250 [Muribaculaceae bacterium]|nr:hypothetical protein [Muribaculaceae bacterium]